MLLQLRTMHEDLMFFKGVKSIPAAVAVRILLGQDVFPQLPWETGSRIPGQPSSEAAVLGSQLCQGYEPAWDTQPLEMLDNLLDNFREVWKPLISVVHRPLRQQKSSEPKKLRQPGLQSMELPGGFGAQDPGKARDRQVRSLNWNH